MSRLKKEKKEQKKTTRRDFFMTSATMLASIGTAYNVIPLIDSLSSD